ncbi:hypothetical protein KP509_22G051800 [Ceratopteris richardii]|uniref:F-box domain-containing protein n=1 Tax=Ceratopteris richardii TaxID=49495 RepID=A0A8T2S7U3_CERRI|nr:hypothetical protein KP509_22G051800 [Ceratopteris richardii]
MEGHIFTSCTGKPLALLDAQYGKDSISCNTNTSEALVSTCSLSEDRGTGSVEIDPLEILPDHLIVEVITRLPVKSWVSAACVRKRWAGVFKTEMLWQTALKKRWPSTGSIKRWPGPIGRGPAKRRYIALHLSKSLFSFEDEDGEIYELAGHIYLYLKEQLQMSTSLSYGLLHGTVIDSTSCQPVTCRNNR